MDQDRFFLEHQMIPHTLFSDDCQWLIVALARSRGAVLPELYRSMHRDEPDYVCPYGPDQFGTRAMRMPGTDGSDLFILEVLLPEPEAIGLCRRLFILHDENFENPVYVTEERTADGAALGGWGADGAHRVYGPAPESEEALRIRLAELYLTEI